MNQFVHIAVETIVRGIVRGLEGKQLNFSKNKKVNKVVKMDPGPTKVEVEFPKEIRVNGKRLE